MKKVYVLLLAMLLVLTGCAKPAKGKDISVKDGSYPYKIDHKKDAVVVTLQDAAKSGVLWRAEVSPADICTVAEEKAGKDHTCQYRVTGTTEGAACLTLTALQEDETAKFVLQLIVDVDEKGKTTVSNVHHQERIENTVEADGLRYIWSVDVNGNLQFAFSNDEDRWRVQGDGGDVCRVTDAMATPSGCQFSAQALEPGETTVTLTGATTRREIQVTLRVDDEGKLEVASVQE